MTYVKPDTASLFPWPLPPKLAMLRKTMAEYLKLSTNRSNLIRHECEEDIASNSTTHVHSQSDMQPLLSNSNDQ